MRDEPQTIAGKLARAQNARVRGAIRVAEVVKANHSLTWERNRWAYELERAPWDKTSERDNQRHAAVYDLRVTAGDTVIFRDRVQCWDGSPVMVPDGTFDLEGNAHFREDPVEAARIDLEHTVRVVTKGGTKPWVKAQPGTVDTFYAGTGDGLIESSNASYATARAGGSFFVRTTATSEGMGWQIPGGTYNLVELFFAFDTSTLPDDTTIDDAVFSLYVSTTSGTSWTSIYAREYDYGASLTSADWRAMDGTSATDTLLAQIARTSITTSQYNDLTSEAALLTAINLTGVTGIYTLISNGESASAPTGSQQAAITMADNTGTTQDPKLVVTHTPAAPAFTPFRRSLLGVGF